MPTQTNSDGLPTLDSDWKPIPFREIVRLTQGGDQQTRWTWLTYLRASKKLLCLRSPDGTVYHVKLQRGFWIKPLLVEFPHETLVS